MKSKSSTVKSMNTHEPFFLLKYKWALIPMLFAIALYFNTRNHGFVLDDNLITQDVYLKQGISGFFDLFTQKTLPEVGNIKPYRPVTSVSFALDYSLFYTDNSQQFASKLHLMNILYYGLALFFTFVFIRKLFKSDLIAIAVSMVFASHPLHTEVVANLKSRDEILAYFFGIVALIFYVKFIETNRKKWLYFGLGAYFAAILSKESAILFIGVIPFIGYFLNSKKSMQWEDFKEVRFFIIPALLYLFIQRMVIGMNLMPNMTEIDNMLVGITNSSDNIATRIYIVGLYLYKIIYPNQLLYDYSINTITVKSFKSFEVWISILAIIALVIIIFKGLLKRSKLAFGLLFMCIMFLLTCNLFIAIGATFAERFAFTPVLGFAIALVFLIDLISKKVSAKPIVLLLFLLPIISLYSIRTYSRNKDWKDNETLFSHDYLESSKSLRMQNNYASIFYQKAKKTEDSIAKKEFFLKSIKILDAVTQKYDNYIEAYIQKGISYLEIKDCENAVKNLETAKRIAKFNFLIESNLAISYINCGRSKEAVGIFTYLLENDKPLESFYLRNLGVAHYNIKNIDSSELYFNRLREKYPNDAEGMAYIKLVEENKNKKELAQKQTQSQSQTQVKSAVIESDSNILFNEAYAAYQSSNKKKAKKLLDKLIMTDPNHALGYAVLGLIADENQDYPNAIKYYKKSIALNPGDHRIYFNLGNTYLKSDREEEALIQFEKCISISPTYTKAIKALEVYYLGKNNIEKAAIYTQKLKTM